MYGYVVEGEEPGTYLEKTRERFIKLPRGWTPYVHTLQQLNEPGCWKLSAEKVFPARFDEIKNNSEITHPVGIPVIDFMSALDKYFENQ